MEVVPIPETPDRISLSLTAIDAACEPSNRREVLQLLSRTTQWQEVKDRLAALYVAMRGSGEAAFQQSETPGGALLHPIPHLGEGIVARLLPWRGDARAPVKLTELVKAFSDTAEWKAAMGRYQTAFVRGV